MSITLDPATLTDLRQRMTGELILPGDAEYDSARAPWNLAVQQHPSAAAFPADVDDIRHILAAAADAGLGVTVQPNGHGAADDLDGVILIRPRAFDEVSIDVDGRRARVGAGVNWGRVLTALDGTGLIALAGSNPEVNAVAYTLGGGQSLFGRAFGLASESLTAVELIDAGGRLHRVTDESDADLMWALRGGGGLFGVVTSIEFTLHPADRLFGGSLMFPIDAAAAVFRAATEASALDDGLGAEVGLMRFPDLPMMPPPLRGQTLASVNFVHLGDEASAAPVVEVLRAAATAVADTLTEFTIGQLAAVANEPTDPMPTLDWGGSIASLDDDTVAALVSAFLSGVDLGLSRVGVRVLGGRIAEPTDALLGGVSAEGVASAGAMVFDPSTADRAASALQPLRDFAETHRGAGMIPTFLGYGSTLADAFGPEAIDRLRALKDRVDPGGVIRSNRPLG